MTTPEFLKLYFLTVPVFFAIDMIWITLMNQRFYAKHIGDMLTKQINWPAAFSFYMLYIGAIILFAVTPAIRDDSVQKAIFFGAFFGFVAYATYDLTNLATLRGWPLNVTLVDMVWGAVLTGSVSAICFYLAKWLKIV